MNSCSFNKESRLLTKDDFSNLKSHSCRTKSKLLISYSKLNSNFEFSRLGLAISKKAGNAVVRNSVKRVIRELFRISEIRTLGVDILFVATPNLLKKTSKESLKSVIKLSFIQIEKEILKNYVK